MKTFTIDKDNDNCKLEPFLVQSPYFFYFRNNFIQIISSFPFQQYQYFSESSSKRPFPLSFTSFSTLLSTPVPLKKFAYEIFLRTNDLTRSSLPFTVVSSLLSSNCFLQEFFLFI